MINSCNLSGAKVQLTEVRPADADVQLLWSREMKLKRLSGPGPFFPRTLEEVQKRLEARGHDQAYFAIRPTHGESLLGLAGFRDIVWSNQVAELYIQIGAEEDWGKGYGKEALELLLRYGFHELNLYRIQLSVVSYNTHAINLYKKLGFQHEGTLRSYICRNKTRYDFELYGLLYPEWSEASQQ